MWTISISPYPGRLGKLPNALCCLLVVATQQVCKFSSADCRHAVEICLRTIENCNQLGNCFIWDILQLMIVPIKKINNCNLSHCHTERYVSFSVKCGGAIFSFFRYPVPVHFTKYCLFPFQLACIT